MTPQALKRALIKRAEAQGFVLTRVTNAVLPERIAHDLADFIGQNHHGEMTWMAETQDRRDSPDHLWPEARCAVVLAMSYAPADPPLEGLARDGQLMAYHHLGFWKAMDTLRDKNELEALWASGRAPWQLWE